LAVYLKRAEGVSVSWRYVAKLWRDNDLKPHRSGTFKISKDPQFAEKVTDVVGLYLDPPGARSCSRLTRRRKSRLGPYAAVAAHRLWGNRKRTHDYKRHGTTNLFAALDIATGEVVGGCYPRRTSADFLDFMQKAVKPHAGKDIHVILDNLSTHDTPEVKAWLTANPQVTFHFTPVGSSWINMIETWFGIITKQSIRRGTFTSVNALVLRIRGLHPAVEHRRATVHLDRNRRRDPSQGCFGSG
jgi:transposase